MYLRGVLCPALGMEGALVCQGQDLGNELQEPNPAHSPGSLEENQTTAVPP